MRDALAHIVQPLVVLKSNSEQGVSWIASGIAHELIISHNEVSTALERIDDFQRSHADWIFGYIGYDLKNGIESVSTSAPNHLQAPLVHLVVPQVVIRSVGDDLTVLKNSMGTDVASLMSALKPTSVSGNRDSRRIALVARTSRDEYIQQVAHIKQHIARGDVYEMNYCIEHFGTTSIDHPLEVYHDLNARTEAPFSAFVQLGDIAVMCASPERYMQRQINELTSQPIKGTAPRGATPEADAFNKEALRESQKERSENVMIVDLVRNDLSRCAMRASVRVEELFGIYSFKTLHHMISTVKCQVPAHTTFADILRCSFPMGSMTGAPKVRAMQLIDQYEKQTRGIYSGSIGYITPQGDFDFNVVIRSMVYNRKTNYLSVMVGSAITDRSVAEQEYEECLLKAEALIKTLA